MVTNEDRRAEIERIHTEAVGAVLMRICQLFDGIRMELSLEKKHLGYNQKFVVSGEIERECQGLVELVKTSLADDLPVDPRKLVEEQDHFDVLNEDQVMKVSGRVRKTVRELLGVFSKGDDDNGPII